MTQKLGKSRRKDNFSTAKKLVSGSSTTVTAMKFTITTLGKEWELSAEMGPIAQLLGEEPARGMEGSLSGSMRASNIKLEGQANIFQSSKELSSRKLKSSSSLALTKKD
jgi:hypothetical protein